MSEIGKLKGMVPDLVTSWISRQGPEPFNTGDLMLGIERQGDAVHQALSRLTKCGAIKRLSMGVYVAVKKGEEK